MAKKVSTKRKDATGTYNSLLTETLKVDNIVNG